MDNLEQVKGGQADIPSPALPCRDERVVADFRRRRLRQYLAVAPALVLVVLFMWARDRGTPDVAGIPRDAFYGVGLLTLFALGGFTHTNWRCPACHGYLSSFNPRRCPRCRTPLC